MTRTSVDSSNIKSVGYDSSNQTLEVEFKNGKTYQYSPIPVDIHRFLMEANSKGAFFHSNIRNNPAFKVEVVS